MSENEAKTPAQQGWAAFQSGKKKGANPYSNCERAYPEFQKAHAQWLNGWERACKGYDEPKPEGLELVK